MYSNEEKRNFIVYKITNKINENIYIGCHVTENIYDSYMGSGTNIRKAIDAFGKENFDKIVLYNFDNKEDMLEKEAKLVNREFIKRDDTYNIVVGRGGLNTLDTITAKNKNGDIMQVHKDDPRYLSGELVGVKKGITKGTITTKNKNGDYLTVSIDDPRYLSGELVGVKKGMITTKNKNGDYLTVSIDDPRYLSGELLPIWVGRNHTQETKNKMSKSKRGKYLGAENSQYGTCWIYNLEKKENKKIKKEELFEYLDNNWIKGRKMKF